MNFKVDSQNNLKRILFCIVIVFLLFFQTKSQILYSLPMENYKSEFITEELRLQVPEDLKELWFFRETIILG